MRFYLKEDVDGFEFSPVGRKINQAKLDDGFVIVAELPQRIKDKIPGGKDFIEPKTAREEIVDLKARLDALERRP